MDFFIEISVLLNYYFIIVFIVFIMIVGMWIIEKVILFVLFFWVLMEVLIDNKIMLLE